MAVINTAYKVPTFDEWLGNTASTKTNTTTKVGTSAAVNSSINVPTFDEWLGVSTPTPSKSNRGIFSIPTAPDYAEYSKPTESKRNGKSVFSKGDALYDYINDIGGYRKTAAVIAEGTRSGNAWKKYDNLTADEIGTYNYIYAKKGKDKAELYLDGLSPVLDERQYQTHQTYVQDLANKYPVLTSVASVPANLMGSIVGTADLAAQTVNKAVTGKDINFHSAAQSASASAGTARGQISQDIEKNTSLKVGNTNVASFLYNTAMSAADSISAMAFGNPTLAGLTLGLGAGADAARDIAARGGSDAQALVGGIVAGAFESIFERVSLGNLKALKELPVKGIKTIVGNIAKSMGVNASEEGATEIANILFDAIAMGDVSNWQQSIDNYKKQGMTEKEAKRQTVKDLIAQVLQASASGGVMGMFFGGGGSAASAISNRPQTVQQPAQPVTQLPTQPQAVQAPTSPAVATSQTASVAQPQTVQTQVEGAREEKAAQPPDATDEKSIKAGNGSISGLKIKYNPSLNNEARNHYSYIDVGDKFFDLDTETQAVVLSHEVQHTLANDLYNGNATLFEAVMNNPAFGERKTTPDGRPYWEGIFGDVGSNSVDETFTEALAVYDRNPQWLKEYHPQAYEFVKQYKNPPAASTASSPATAQKLPELEQTQQGASVAQPQTVQEKVSAPVVPLAPQTQPVAQTTEVQSAIPTNKELLDRANDYADEYYMNLDDATTDEEMKTWKRIRDKMLAKYRSESVAAPTSPTASPPKHAVGAIVKLSDGEEGTITAVEIGENGKPYYSMTADDGREYFAIAEHFITDIKESKQRRNEFLQTIQSPAQQTKAKQDLSVRGVQADLESLANNPDTKSVAIPKTYATKDGKPFTKTEYRIYDGTANGTVYTVVNKNKYDYYNYVRQQRNAPITPQTPQNTPISPVTPPAPIPMPLTPQTQSAYPDLGAAAKDAFSPYTQLQAEATEFHPQGEKPRAETRSVQVPTKDAEGKNISKTVATAMEAPVTPDNAIPDIQNSVAEGNMSHFAITDSDAKTKAVETIRRLGFEDALKQWTRKAAKGSVTKYDIAVAQQLYNQAINAGDTKLAVDILVDYVAAVSSAAQVLQASRMLKQLTPDYQLYAIQREVNKLNEDMLKKAKKAAGDIEIDPVLADNFLKAKTEEERAEALDKIYQNIANQLPSTWYDKWNAWRYLSMLGNFRTHIRNIVGNVGFAPARTIKNILGAMMEKTAGVQNRTKAILLPTKNDVARVKAAWADYATVADTVMSAGKFEDTRGEIQDRRRIFKNPVLEVLRKGNTTALTAEDIIFAKTAYATSLAGYMKANNITAEAWMDNRVSPADMNAARAYAIREAQRATYRDHNAVSDFVSKLGKNYGGTSKTGKVVNMAVEAVLPFKRTPANILVRAVEYSPIGLARGIKQAMFDVRSEKVTAAEAIDNLSAGLTGTGIVAIGALLASMGFISSGYGGDDKEKAINELAGRQAYALEIGGKSYTLDWLAPSALPFFVGVEMFNTLTDRSKNGATLADVLTALSSITEPMLEMSMLQGIGDLLDSVKYADGNTILSVIATMAVNYLSQGLPTLSGQVERVTESERQQTVKNSTSGIPNSLQYILGKAANKIPVFDYLQQPYIDALGRTQDSGGIAERIVNNMFNPAYVKDLDNGKIVSELERLYTANADITIPERPSNSFTYGGNKYNMSGEDYTRFATTRGQTIQSVMSEIIGSKAYTELTDTNKASVLSKIVAFANDEAKRELVNLRGGEYTSDWDAERDLPDLPEYLAVQAAYSSMSNSGGAGADTFSKMLGVYDKLSEESQAALNEIPGFKDAAFAAKNNADMTKYYGVKADISQAVKEQGGIDSVDKYRIALDAGMSKKDTNTTLEILMPTETYKKYEASKVGANTFVGFLEELDRVDINNSASTADYLYALDRLPASSRDEKAIAEQYLSEAGYTKYTTALDAGFSTKRYADFYKEKQNRKKDDLHDWALKHGYSEAEFNFLWKLIA